MLFGGDRKRTAKSKHLKQQNMDIGIYLNLFDKTDLFILVIVLILDLILWEKNLNHCRIYFLFILMLGFILPFYSWLREFERSTFFNDSSIHSSEQVSSSLIFVFYWLFLFLQLGYLNIKPHPVEEENLDDILDANL